MIAENFSSYVTVEMNMRSSVLLDGHFPPLVISCLFSSSRGNRSNRGYAEVSKDISSQVDGILIQVRNGWRSLSMGCNVEESRLTNRFIDLSNPLKTKEIGACIFLLKRRIRIFFFFSWGFWMIRLREINRWIVVEENSRTFSSKAFAFFSRDISIEIVIPIEISFVLVRRILIRKGKGILSRINRTHFQISSYDDTIFNIGSMRD